MSTILSANGITRYFLEALGKFATARLRQVGAIRAYPEWEARAEVCERCALRVVSCGKSFCGNPFLKQIERDPAVDGCGCPCRDKAKSAGEHCPITEHYHAAEKHGEMCNCKWCTAGSLAAGAPEWDEALSTQEHLEPGRFDRDVQPAGKTEVGSGVGVE
jgi:hypothetical protein